MGRYQNDAKLFFQVLLKESNLVIWRTFLSSKVVNYRSTQSSSNFFPLIKKLEGREMKNAPLRVLLLVGFVIN